MAKRRHRRAELSALLIPGKGRGSKFQVVGRKDPVPVGKIPESIRTFLLKCPDGRMVGIGYWIRDARGTSACLDVFGKDDVRGDCRKCERHEWATAWLRAQAEDVKC